MKSTLNQKRERPARGGSRQRRYWNGFSVCLFIVLLSVFTWVVHRRLAQYESMQQAGGHHLTATKVCLTERPQISIPSVHAVDRSMMLFVAIAFAGALFRMDNPRPLPIRCDHLLSLHRTRIKRCMAHFFFLPPPVSPITL